MIRHLSTLVIAGVLSVSTVCAFAQSADNTPPWKQTHENSTQWEQSHAMHAEKLKARLQITPAQEAAWAAFTASRKPPVGMDHERPDFAALATLSTPERIEKMRALRKERIAAIDTALTQREEAVKTFYAVLSPEQKKTFDGLIAEHFGRGHESHGNWCHHRGHSHHWGHHHGHHRHHHCHHHRGHHHGDQPGLKQSTGAASTTSAASAAKSGH